MIPKPRKNHSKPENPRPISLLPTISKVFEKLLLQKLNLFFKPRSQQHVFRTEHSTTTQLIKIIDIKINSSKDEKTAAIFLDLEKLFDRVWYGGLLYKIQKSDIPPHLTKLIASFLHNRSFQIKISDNFSSLRKIEAGVPQGSYLSPSLYSLYISNIPTYHQTNLALFTNDTLFYAINKNCKYATTRLQQQIDQTLIWMKKWRLKLNYQKPLQFFLAPHSIEKLIYTQRTIKLSGLLTRNTQESPSTVQ